MVFSKHTAPSTLIYMGIMDNTQASSWIPPLVFGSCVKQEKQGLILRTTCILLMCAAGEARSHTQDHLYLAHVWSRRIKVSYSGPPVFGSYVKQEKQGLILGTTCIWLMCEAEEARSNTQDHLFLAHVWSSRSKLSNSGPLVFGSCVKQEKQGLIIRTTCIWLMCEAGEARSHNQDHLYLAHVWSRRSKVSYSGPLVFGSCVKQ